MLRFYARDGHVCPWPGQKAVGQVRRYIGRKTKIERDHKGRVTFIGHPATEDAVEIDPKSDAGRRIVRLMKIENEAPLWPADKETARACGVKFVETNFRDGEHRAATSAEKPAKKSPSRRGGSSNPSPEGNDQ